MPGRWSAPSRSRIRSEAAPHRLGQAARQRQPEADPGFVVAVTEAPGGEKIPLERDQGPSSSGLPGSYSNAVWVCSPGVVDNLTPQLAGNFGDAVAADTWRGSSTAAWSSPRHVRGDRSALVLRGPHRFRLAPPEGTEI